MVENNFRSLILGIDIDDFLEVNNHNIKLARTNVLEKYFGFFLIVSGIQSDLLKSFPLEEFNRNYAQSARIHYLATLDINMIKAITNVCAGHFSDANIFSRRTVESIRYSMFLREKPELVVEWMNTRTKDGQKKFNRLFQEWLRHDGGGGTKLIESELPEITVFWDKLNNFGPHSNFSLLTFQSSFIAVDGGFRFQSQFHEITPDLKGTALLLQNFFKHMVIHALSLIWWIERSALPHRLSSEQKQFLRDSYRDFMREADKLEPFFRANLSSE